MSRVNQSTSITHTSQNIFPVSEIIDGKLVFEDTKQADWALKTGVFYLKIPTNLDLGPGIKLAQNFYKDLNSNVPGYTGYKQRLFEKSSLGYADRPDQVEQLQLELPLWNEFLPKEVSDLLCSMNTLSVQVLESVLAYCGIPKNDWDLVIGGALENKAGHNTTINHYRPEKEAIGIVGHKDSGYITLLYVSSPGLEAKLNNEWYPIDPKDGYFIVNFGHILEILTENLKKPITAVEHRVRQLYRHQDANDRISFTIFITPRYDGHIYQYDNSGLLGIYRDYMSFLKERFRNVNYASHGALNTEANPKLDADSPSNGVKKISSLYTE